MTLETIELILAVCPVCRFSGQQTLRLTIAARRFL